MGEESGIENCNTKNEYKRLRIIPRRGIPGRRSVIPNLASGGFGHSPAFQDFIRIIRTDNWRKGFPFRRGDEDVMC